MKAYEQYMCAILSNPEWMKSTIKRYGRDGTVGAPELATAVDNLETALRARLDLDDARESFDVESFVKDSEPPPANVG